ncbi:fimbrial protein, partial [Klebsiella pneumoniae]
SYVDWYGGRIELVVTGPVSSGALTPGVIGVVTLQGSDGLYRDGLTTQLTSGNINALACTVNTAQLTFPIGDIPASAFGTVVGTTPAGAQNTQN